MENFIFQQKPNKQEDIQVTCFTISGNEEFLDENGNPRISEETDTENIFAKKIIRDNGTARYSIRIDINNKFVNPMSIYDDKKVTNNFLDSVCRANNKFVEVNLKVFNMYLNFLKTKNLSWFYNAEREMT
jgi:hypothetical protein